MPYIRTTEDKLEEVKELINSIGYLEVIADEMENQESAEELRQGERHAFLALYAYQKVLEKKLREEIKKAKEDEIHYD